MSNIRKYILEAVIHPNTSQIERGLARIRNKILSKEVPSGSKSKMLKKVLKSGGIGTENTKEFLKRQGYSDPAILKKIKNHTNMEDHFNIPFSTGQVGYDRKGGVTAQLLRGENPVSSYFRKGGNSEKKFNDMSSVTLATAGHEIIHKKQIRNALKKVRMDKKTPSGILSKGHSTAVINPKLSYYSNPHESMANAYSDVHLLKQQGFNPDKIKNTLSKSEPHLSKLQNSFLFKGVVDSIADSTLKSNIERKLARKAKKRYYRNVSQYLQSKG